MKTKKSPKKARKLEMVRFLCSKEERAALFLAAGEEDKGVSEYLRELTALAQHAKREGKVLVATEPGYVRTLQEGFERVLELGHKAMADAEDNMRRWMEAQEQIAKLREQAAAERLEHQERVFELRSQISDLKK